MSDRHDPPLGLYEVLEEEYISLHGPLDEYAVVRLPDGVSARGYRAVRAKRDWLFYRGHIKNPVALADKLLSVAPADAAATRRAGVAGHPGAPVQKPTLPSRPVDAARPTTAASPNKPAEALAVRPQHALWSYLLKKIPGETLETIVLHRTLLTSNLNAVFDAPIGSPTEASPDGRNSDPRSDQTRQMAPEASSDSAAETSDSARNALTTLEDALNGILKTNELYTEARFRDIQFHGPLAAFLETGTGQPEGDITRLNRLLLEQAFPDELETASNVRLAAIHQRFHALDNHAALCLSGGGIRSGTFALGLLQGLARRNLLKEFDYLSTVSGGGYIGSWLTAWLHRDPRGLAGVTSRLANSPPEVSIDPDPDPLRYLRSYSNFITPKAGLLTADTWTFVAMYLRNLFLNWTVIVPLVVGFLMLPRWYVSAVLATPPDDATLVSIKVRSYLLAVGALLSIAAVAYTSFSRPHVREQLRGRSPFWFKRADQRSFLTYCMVPLVMAATLLTIYWAWSLNAHRNDPVREWWLYVLFGVIVTSAGWFVSLIVLRRFQPRHWRENSKTELGVLALAGGIGGFLFWITERLLKSHPPVVFEITESWKTWGTELYAVLAVPVFLGGFLVAMTLFIGLTSHQRKFADEDREWWARANAWILIACVVWLVFSALVILGPVGLTYFPKLIGAVGGVSGLIALLAGKSARTPAVHEPGAHNGVSGWMKHIGLPGLALIFLLVFAACLSLLTSGLIVGIANVAADVNLPEWLASRVKAVLTIEQKFVSADTFDRQAFTYLHIWSIHYPSLLFTTTVIALTIGSGVLMARLVNLNRFTLHAGYRDRLIRAFLGASRQAAERKPNAFTGFDPADNIQMHELRPALLHEDDFENIGALAIRLRDGPDPVSRYLWEYRLTKPTKADITSFSGDTLPSPSMKVALIEDLNRALEDPHQPLFEQDVFQAFFKDEKDPVAVTMKERATQHPQVDYRIVLNRRLLQTAYGEQIRRKYPPPHHLFHVVNTALNLVGGDNLAWQQRKAEPFSVTPLHCGCFRLGYRRSLYYGGEDGISIGTAVAISGAAASSNMGYYTTSPVLSMVLTLFNVRLGWWLGNPGPAGATCYRRQSPKYAIAPIVQEALGLTDDKNKYVYLSDGGHFENLALYEMVLRRCRIIVVSDAGADEAYQFNDLGNAIRKIRIDLGVPIEFKEVPIHAVKLDSPEHERANETAGSYFAVGRVGYSCVDVGAEDGVLIYIKPAVYGNEPQDVLQYKRAHPPFPHETTADQFFDEPQFESYRALGSFVMDQILEGARNESDLKSIVRALYRQGSLDGQQPQWPTLEAKWLTTEG